MNINIENIISFEDFCQVKGHGIGIYRSNDHQLDLWPIESSLLIFHTILRVVRLAIRLAILVPVILSHYCQKLPVKWSVITLEIKGMVTTLVEWHFRGPFNRGLNAVEFLVEWPFKTPKRLAGKTIACQSPVSQ